MLEFLLCSLVTILPDFLVRRYVQGKRWGQEINLFSMWYELRWGITSCAILTVSLITVIFYYHPSTTNVSSFFRTVTILSEGGGRVAEVYVINNQRVAAGDPLFRLDGATQEASADTARRQIAEVDAALLVAKSELDAAIGTLDQAEAAYQQALDELARKQILFDQGSSAVTEREIEILENQRDARKGVVDAAIAGKQAVETKIQSLLPAKKASAEAALNQATTEIEKLTIYAGTSGTIQQFALQPGDYVNPILRPAGILVPKGSGQGRFQAGFGQITSQVIHPGMLAEITCVSKPFTIIPMVITEVQDVIAAGQVRPTDQLIDPQDRARPGTLTVFMEPLYAGQTDDIPPGSKCIANAYTNNHDKFENANLSASRWLFLHMVDTVGLVHAFILRIQAVALPVQSLVFTGH
ncbi:MAG: biotin/lipoyl-binding protein [Paracoccaceae bacterium]|nr:biotin/lipoyl-binding protein [Paracoccaceae bacterium]